MKSVSIRTESIELQAFLKWAGVVTQGGEGKVLIVSGDVSVNGEKETRRSRKLVVGDSVAVHGENYLLTRHDS